jgi:hypothetical protein
VGTKDGLRSRALGAMLAHAFFRLESALTIALTLVLITLVPSPFYWWQWWYWLILGIVGETLIVVSSLNDAATGRQVVSDMLEERCNPGEIRAPELRNKVQRALEYQRRMSEQVARSPQGPLRDRLQSSTEGVGDWINSIFGLAKRLDSFHRDELIRDDLASVQGDLQALNQRLRIETDPAVLADVRDALKAKEVQRDNLDSLQNTMERAEVQLDATLTALGTVYSQLMLVGARDVDSAHSRRIEESVHEQVASLNDLLSAMNQVYAAK